MLMTTKQIGVQSYFLPTSICVAYKKSPCMTKMHNKLFLITCILITYVLYFYAHTIPYHFELINGLCLIFSIDNLDEGSPP